MGLHDTGCLGLVHWDDPEGWCGEGGGRRVQDGAAFNETRAKPKQDARSGRACAGTGLCRRGPLNALVQDGVRGVEAGQDLCLGLGVSNTMGGQQVRVSVIN